MNPFLQLQEDTAARLATHPLLADIPIITETLGNVTNRIDIALLKGGIKPGSNQKPGIAILIITPHGRGNQTTRTSSAQIITIRISVFVRPLINDSPNGQQKAPLDVHHAAMNQMLSWRSGPGQPIITLDAWDSRETPQGELSYFADYGVPLTLTIAANS